MSGDGWYHTEPFTMADSASLPCSSGQITSRQGGICIHAPRFQGTSLGLGHAQRYTKKALKFSPSLQERLLRLNAIDKYRERIAASQVPFPWEALAMFKQPEESSTVLTSDSAVVTVPSSAWLAACCDDQEQQSQFSRDQELKSESWLCSHRPWFVTAYMCSMGRNESLPKIWHRFQNCIIRKAALAALELKFKCSGVRGYPLSKIVCFGCCVFLTRWKVPYVLNGHQN